jgi:HEAT repeat protein
MGDPRAVEPLISVLRDGQGDFRAVEALGEIGDARAVEPLIGILFHQGGNEHAAEALGKIGNPEAVEPLLLLCASSINSESGGSGLRAAEAALVRLGTGAVEPLMEALASHEIDLVRRSAARALGGIRDAQAIESPVAALGDRGDGGWIREEAKRALARYGSEAVPPLIEALKDDDERVRHGAAQALGRIGDPKAVEPLMAAVRDEDRWVRLEATRALGAIGDTRAVEALIDILGHEDRGARHTAAQSLGQVGDARATEPLLRALADDDEFVRQAARGSLLRLRGRTSP